MWKCKECDSEFNGNDDVDNNMMSAVESLISSPLSEMIDKSGIRFHGACLVCGSDVGWVETPSTLN